jgi:hypothetical protein
LRPGRRVLSRWKVTLTFSWADCSLKTQDLLIREKRSVVRRNSGARRLCFSHAAL